MKHTAILALLLAVCLLLATACGSLTTATTDTAAPTTAATDVSTAAPSGTDEGETVPAEAVGFEIAFVTDENVTVTVYETQDDLTSGENGTANATVAYSRDGDAGTLTQDGTGQVNFLLTFAEGYVLDAVTIESEDGYNKLKGAADTGVENGYRITKITADLVVTVTAKEETAAEDLSNGYQVSFVTGEHVSVTVYPTQALTGGTENATVAYSREAGTGTLTKTDGQVNFLLVFDEGYELDGEITVEGSYKNLKDLSADGTANAYRLTKIASDLTVTVNAKAIETA